MKDELLDAELMAVARGERPYTWDVWASGVEDADVLTERGRTEVRAMIVEMATFLGDDWLPSAYTSYRETRGALKLPLMSMAWLPGNNVHHVYAHILTLGARLRLFKGTSGVGDLRRNLRGEPRYFEHAMMQLEVAALAKRAGWTVVFEPPVSAVGLSRGDLLLSRGTGQVLVEVRGFELDEATRRDMATSELVGRSMINLSIELEVTFAGDIEPDFPVEEITPFLERLRRAGQEARACSRTVVVGTPAGHPVSVFPGIQERAVQSMTIRHGDELARLRRAISQKIQQGMGSIPLWLRFNETGLFWSLAAPRGYPRPKLHAFLGDKLGSFMASSDNVAGMMLSSTPGFAALYESMAWGNLSSRSASLICPTVRGFARESLLVPGPATIANEQIEEWRSWYVSEDSWLEWALDELDLPPLSELFTR